MTGFAAASYMRAWPFVQVPTTLLAQVDSSSAAKTAINHPLRQEHDRGVHQPLLVFFDLETLATLPPRDFSAAWPKSSSTGRSPTWIPSAGWRPTSAAWLQRRTNLIAHAVKRSCEIRPGRRQGRT